MKVGQACGRIVERDATSPGAGEHQRLVGMTEKVSLIRHSRQYMCAEYSIPGCVGETKRLNQVPFSEAMLTIVVSHPPHQVRLFSGGFINRSLNSFLMFLLSQGKHVAIHVLQQRGPRVAP